MSSISVTKSSSGHGRVIRRYRKMIPIEDFVQWQEQISRKARGCGLYALYREKKLVYVGLATQNLKRRIKYHIRRGHKDFSHFSVFLVTGSKDAQGRRIRDLEALLLNILEVRPDYNKTTTKFIGAKELKRSTSVDFSEE